MKSLFVVTILLLPIFSFSQNLVENGKFNFRSCPDSIVNGTASNVPWNIMHILTNSWQSYRGTPDASDDLSQCDNAISFGYQATLDTTEYYGFLSYVKNDWILGGGLEILGCELLQPLTVGQAYNISFKASLAETSNYACNNLGVLFLNREYQSSNGFATDMPFPNQAHFYSSQIISDTANWIEISGTFTADSAYTHMAIGRLEDDGFDSLLIPQQWPTGYAYYFIDDICVVPEGGDCSEMVALKQPTAVPQQLTILPNPAIDYVDLDWGTQTPEGGECLLINVSGQVVQRVAVSAGSRQLRLDTTGLPSGMYYVSLRCGAMPLLVARVYVR